MSNKGRSLFPGLKPRIVGEGEAKSTVDRNQPRGLKPRTVGEGVARGRALSLPNLPRLPSPGFDLRRRDISQPSVNSQSRVANKEKVATMAPPAENEPVEKLKSLRNMAVNKLLSVLQDTTNGLASTPNKRKCERLAKSLKDANVEVEDLETELNNLDPEANIIDKIDDFTDQGLEEAITLRRAVTLQLSKIDDRLDTLLEEDKNKEANGRIIELSNDITRNVRRFKKAVQNTDQHLKEAPDKALITFFKAQTFGTISPIYDGLTTQIAEILKYEEAVLQATVHQTRESFLSTMEETETLHQDYSLKWGIWIRNSDPDAAEATSSIPRHREASGESDGGRGRGMTAKMEKLKYPKFAGSCKEYAQFIKDYTLLVKDSTPNPRERAITLKTQCLTGDAKKAVLPVDDEEKMLEVLRIRWGKPDDLVEELLRELDSLPRAKQYDINFIKFIDAFKSLCHNLEAIEEKGQLSNVPTLKKIIGKMPYRAKEKLTDWKEDKYSKTKVSERLDVLLEFLEKQREKAQDIIGWVDTNQEKPKNPPNPPKKGLGLAIKGQENGKCIVENCNYKGTTLYSNALLIKR